MQFAKTAVLTGGMAVLFLACFARADTLDDDALRAALTRLAVLAADSTGKDMRWVSMKAQGRRFGIFKEDGDVFRADGNAFVFDEKKDGTARALVLVTGIVMQAHPENKGGDDAPNLEPRMDRVVAAWKDADAGSDVEAAVEWLRKEAEHARKAGALVGPVPVDDGFGGGSQGAQRAAEFAKHQQTALLWASLLQHTGRGEDALVLARAALTGADEERLRDLLDHFFDRLGANSYQKIMSAAAAHRDWERLRKELDALVKKLPLGWQAHTAARVVLRQVGERARLPARPPLKTARPFSEDQQKVIFDWLEELDSGKHPGHTLWTLPPPGGADPRSAGAPEHETRFPRSHGLEAVPVLAALLEDDTLTFTGLGRSGHPGAWRGQHRRFSMPGNRAGEMEELRQKYAELEKPATRASLAWDALRAVLPNELQHSGTDTPADLIPDILAWHRSVKDASPADLALAYLEGGRRDSGVLDHALAIEDSRKLARLDDAMIQQAHIWDMTPLTAYVEKLGPAKGAAFTAKLREKLEGELARYGDSQEQLRKQMDSGLKRLEAAAKGEVKTGDIQATLAVLAASDPDAGEEAQMLLREAHQDLRQFINKNRLPDRLKAILPALPDFKSPDMASQALHLLFLGNPQNPDQPSEDEIRELFEATKPHWRRLIETRTAGSDEDARRGLMVSSVIQLEKLLGGGDNAMGVIQISSLGDRGIEAVRQRGMALLSGEKPPPLPAPESGAGTALIAEWADKSAADLAAAIETLDIEKLLALELALAAQEEIPANFKTRVSLIQQVKVTGAGDEAEWQAWKGRRLDPKNLTDLARRLSTFPGEGVWQAALHRQAAVFGYRLEIRQDAALNPRMEMLRYQARQTFGDELPKTAARYNSASYHVRRKHGSWSWLDAPVLATDEAPAAGKEEADSDAERTSAMNEAAERNWQDLFDILAENPAGSFYIQFLSAPASLLISK